MVVESCYFVGSIFQTRIFVVKSLAGSAKTASGKLQIAIFASNEKISTNNSRVFVTKELLRSLLSLFSPSLSGNDSNSACSSLKILKPMRQSETYENSAI